MMVSRPASAARFDNRQAQLVGATCAGLFALIGISMVAHSATRWSGASFTVVSAFLLVRALRSSGVVVDGAGVVTRSLVRTRRYEFAGLRGVDVAVGRTGFTGFGREYLVFRRVDGWDASFKELNCRPSKALRECRWSSGRRIASTSVCSPRDRGPGQLTPPARARSRFLVTRASMKLLMNRRG
jgi:hypothetical protein